MADEAITNASPAAPATTEPTKEMSGSNGDVTMKDTSAEGENADQTASKEGPNGIIKGDAADVAIAEAAEPGEAKEAEPATETAEDAVMVDTNGPSAANGTPASSKKASGGSAKKKGSGVPEHKSKKLNKKKSRPLTNLEANPGDYYLARMKGHPPWPSIICDEEMLPQSLVSTRPVTTAMPDGSFRRADYGPGGKRAHERTFPIMFLETNEFAWILNTDLAPLSIEDAQNPSEKGKSKTLLEAFKRAGENRSLADFKKMLADHTAAVQADEEAQAEREAQKAEKAAKAAKRKSTASAAAGDDDEMDVDEDGAEGKPKSKKRKKSLADVDDEEKPAKTPKTSGKIKLTGPKTPNTDTKSKKASTKSKSSTLKKAAANVADDSSEEPEPKAEEKPLTEAELKEKKENTVLYFRHKLQRGFLSRDSAPKNEEMKSMSDYLSELEALHDLEGAIIRATKIHKVLKAMIKLPSIPLDEEFKFKDRSHALLQKWNEILGTVGGGGEAEKDKEESGKEKDEAPAAAGSTTAAAESDKTGDEATAKKAESNGEAKAAVVEEDENPKNLENKIGTTVEGEKEAVADDHKAEPATNHKATEASSMPTTDTEVKDAPDVDKAPEKEYQPPTATATAEAAADDDEPAA